MTDRVQQVTLLEVSTRRCVDAELSFGISETDLQQSETVWASEQAEAIKRLIENNVPRDKWDQSSHWNWRRKIEPIRQLLTHGTFSIRVKGMVQGMMVLKVTGTARVESQKGNALVYVDFVQNAPWNRPELTGGAPRYRGIGSILVGEAINFSLDEEMKGRIALHSLPQSERFYRDKCGMSDLGPDGAYQNLRYFEMTPEQAEQYGKGGQQK